MFNQVSLEIAKLGEPVLRKKAKKVKSISDKKIQKLISHMLVSVKNQSGVGLAAPQVFKSLQIMIIASKPNNRYPSAPFRMPFVLINPKIIKASKSKEKDWEGCLSIPGIRAKVPRHKKITVQYLTQSGENKIEKFEGFIARVFQHEYDHLKGLVYLDNIETTKDIIAEEVYFKMGEKAKK